MSERSERPVGRHGGGARLTARELAAVLDLPVPTEEQAAVIEAPLEPALVVAGAGSGKTETMAARVVWLVANGLARPEQVLGLTFTRKAAGELSARVGYRLRQLAATHVVPAEVILAGEPTVSTYHAYAARIVAEHGVRLGIEPSSRLLTDAVRWQHAARAVRGYDGDMTYVDFAPDTVTSDLLALADEMGEHFVGPEDLCRFTGRLVAEIEALAAARSKLPGGVYQSVRDALDRQQGRLQLLPLVQRYVRGKRAAEALDYGDQMGLAARLARSVPEIGRAESRRFSAVLLDEYQDTSYSQLVLLRSLFADGHAVMAVGDPCQSIYGWRGASAGSLQRFPEHFPVSDGTLLPRPAAVRELSTSWRNDGRILDLANALSEGLRAAGARVPVLTARAGRERSGAVRCALLETAEDEATWLAGVVAERWAAGPVSVAVLTRRRSQQRTVEAALRARGLPVDVLGLGGLLDTPEVRDVACMLRVAIDPSAGDALVRLLSGARWRLGPRDLTALGRRAVSLARSEQPARSLSPDPDDTGSIVDALDDLGPATGYSEPGHARLRALRDELRALRRRLDQPLPDLIADVERTLGLDVELAVRRPREQALARGHLDAFLDIAGDFAADLSGDGLGLLPGFLGYLAAAEEQERGLEAGVVERHDDAVQILTVHGAKGLEWDVVAIPGLTTGVFPSSDAGGDVWTGKLGMVPYPLRGDAADLPSWELAGADNQKDAETALETFKAAAKAIGQAEERRLAYVAVTRARHQVICSAYWWDDATRPRGPSPLMAEVRVVCEAGGGTVEQWAAQPEPGAANPQRAEVRRAAWPFDPLGSRRAAVDEAARLVRSAASVVPASGEDEWSADIALLLAERSAAGRDDPDVPLPGSLSVSQLVTLRRDPAELAAQIRRPMPVPPAPLARRGTAFHRWLEQRFGAPRLLDLDELPGAADEGADDRELAQLQTAFLASAWADRTPVEVEVPFELRLAGLSLRGRMDAVFLDADGRYDVVDWKTGRPPTDADAAAVAVQLAAYRLAWAALAGVPPEQVTAAFHYVRPNRTVRPADLLDGDGLRALVEGLPVAG